MCRWLIYQGKPVFIEQFVTKPKNSLIHQSQHASEAKTEINGDGLGVGWYNKLKKPGLYREVLPAWSDCNLKTYVSKFTVPYFLHTFERQQEALQHVTIATLLFTINGCLCTMDRLVVL